MKKVLIIFFLITVWLSACTTTKRSPEEKIQKYIEKAEECYGKENYNQAKVNLEKALQLTKNEYGEKSSETANIYLKLADFSTSFREAIDHLQEAEEIYQDLKDMGGLAKTYMIYGSTYSGAYDKDSSENAYNTALQYCDNSSEDMNTERFYTYLYLSGLNNGSDEEQLLYSQEAEKLLDSLPEYDKNVNKVIVYSNLGNCYYDLKQYEEAIKNYNIAINIWLKFQDGEQWKVAECYDYCGRCYIILGNYNKAIEYMNQTLSLLKGVKEASLWDYAIVYRHLSILYSVSEIQDYDKVLDYSIRSCQIYTEQEELSSKELEELKNFKDGLKEYYEESPLAEEQDFESWYTERINQ